MKRFYRTVQVSPGAEGFAVTLDGKPVLTPARAPLNLAGERLAQEIAEEWRSQGDEILPHLMGLTTLAGAAIDRVAPLRQEVIAEALKYAKADLLCYHAQAPRDLTERQRQTWGTLLVWAKEDLGAELKTAAGIQHVAQPPEAIESLRRAVEDLDDLELTALSVFTAATGSLVIALALTAGRIGAEAAARDGIAANPGFLKRQDHPAERYH